MKKEHTTHKRKFEHHNLEGSHFEIGKMQGKIIKKNKEAVKMYTSGNFKPEKSKFENFDEVYDFYDKHCPGLSEEAQGFAEELNVNLNKLFFYDFPISIQNKCSQFIALPAITKNNHVLVGRSYEWNFNDEDLQLRTTKVDNKYKHIGFSGMCYGRYEGLNDQGLCVTASSGGAWDAPQKNKSLNWALAIRVLLDNCKNVSEATKTLKKIPVEGTNNFILSDKNGNASYLECFDTDFDIKTYDQSSENHYIIGTNHYNFPNKIELNKHNNPWLLPNSKQRFEIIETALKKDIPEIEENTILNILSNEMPEGICCHWQTDFFGTLWQILFNVSLGKAKISFGPSTHNKWFDFTLEDSIEKHEYEVVFPDKRIEV
ncbi:MAG: C45 family autoproteolytic acyltransferase/hydrolase [Candidatus Thorarchaeota archaeon]